MKQFFEGALWKDIDLTQLNMAGKHVICDSCWNQTTRQQYESEKGCDHCGIGPNTETSGIQCEFCKRSFSHDFEWDNAYSKLIWEYGLEDHPAATEWTMMCYNCCADDELREIHNKYADEMAIEYFQKEHKKLQKVVLKGLQNAVNQHISRKKNIH